MPHYVNISPIDIQENNVNIVTLIPVPSPLPPSQSQIYPPATTNAAAYPSKHPLVSCTSSDLLLVVVSRGS